MLITILATKLLSRCPHCLCFICELFDVFIGDECASRHVHAIQYVHSTVPPSENVCELSVIITVRTGKNNWNRKHGTMQQPSFLKRRKDNKDGQWIICFTAMFAYFSILRNRQPISQNIKTNKNEALNHTVNHKNLNILQPRNDRNSGLAMVVWKNQNHLFCVWLNDLVK